MKTANSVLPHSTIEQLQKAFEDFQERAEKLSNAYASLQEDFKTINIELDKKNKELAHSLASQEETQTYLNSILESMNNGVISIDTQAKITQFNSAAAKITGYESEEVIGKHFVEMFPGNTLGERTVLDALHSGSCYTREEKLIWQKEGAPVMVSFQSALLKDKTGTLLGAVEIFSDISRIKALEEEMQRNKTMVALGEMAATVAHEIRNPLGAMGVWASLLERDLEKNDHRRATLGKITSALARLNHIVSNLLVYSRPLKTQFRRIILQDLIDETVNFIEIETQRQEKPITIEKSLHSQKPLAVMADPEKLQQLIMNLCLNAIQAMPHGGTLTVSCVPVNKKNGNYVSFVITDTGMGIKKENIEKIFDPFYTSKESGTGLGLAIVKKFVDYHSGYIKVNSKVNKGTSVQVFLPHAEKQEQEL